MYNFYHYTFYLFVRSMEKIDSKLKKTNDSIQIAVSAFLFFYVFLTMNVLSIVFQLINFGSNFLKFQIVFYCTGIISFIINYYLIFYKEKWVKIVSFYRVMYKYQSKQTVTLFCISIIISCTIFFILLTSIRDQIAAK